VNDSYQAIYDAVRSRISGGNVAEAVSDAARQAFDVSHLTPIVAQEFYVSAVEARRPSVLWRPSLSIDGNQWCALYGDDLQSGVAGFGDSPSAAMHDFDRAWAESLSAASTAAQPKERG
jgi:hypothetical protein